MNHQPITRTRPAGAIRRAVELLEPRRMLSATLYATVLDDTGTLVRLDTATGQVTTVGIVNVPQEMGFDDDIYSGSFNGFSGLAAGTNGTLYALAEYSVGEHSPYDELYTVNPTTAAVVADLGEVGDDPFTGLALGSNGLLYTTFTQSGSEIDLYSVSTAGGQFARVGDFTPTQSIDSNGGLSPDGTAGLFATGGVSGTTANVLAAINPTSGADTVIGPIAQGTTNFTSVGGLAVGGDGVLYGYDSTSNQILSIDPTTGAAAVVSTVANLPTNGLYAFTGAPTGSVTPTPTPSPTPTPTPTPSPTPTTTALTPTVASSTLATAVISGTKAKPGKVVVTVTNSTTATESGTAKVALYATTTGVIDADSTLVGSASKKLKLAAGKSATFAVPVASLQLPAGTYTVLPQATDAAGVVTTGTAGPTVTVAAPFVDLSAVVGAVSPTALTPGKPLSVTVTLTNTGNTNVAGAGSVTLALSSDGTTLSVPFTPVKHAIAVKANGKALSIRLKVKTPATVPAGTYVVLATVVQGANTATAVGTTRVTFG